MRFYTIRYKARNFLVRHPFLFYAYYSRHPRCSDRVVKHDTELVIEGFPRSANTFALFAFQKAQDQPVRIAHHLHAQSQIELGVRYGLPVITLIREPIGAVTSLVTRHPENGVKESLLQYLKFYSSVAKLAEQVVIAEFDTVINDYGSIIRRVNTKFGTRFLLYYNTPALDDQIFAEIDALNLEKEQGAIHQLARPSQQKKSLLESRKPEVSSHPLIGAATELFNALSETARQGTV